jgi:uncharacterized protein YkwD
MTTFRIMKQYWMAPLLAAPLACESGEVRDARYEAPVIADSDESPPSVSSTTPLTLGSAPFDATPAQKEALYWVNTYRSRAGLQPVHQLGTLNRAAVAHAAYVLSNPDLYEGGGMSVHEQKPGRPAYTGERFWDRLSGAGYSGEAFREVIAYQASPAAAVAHWLETVYHRLPLLHPESTHVGYGDSSASGEYVNVLDLGTDPKKVAEVPTGVVWPPEGAADVQLSWDGAETPAPPAPPAGFPSGPVITLQFADRANFVVHRTTIRDVAEDIALGHVRLSAETDPNLGGDAAVVMYTHTPLLPGRTYKVVVEGKLDGTEFLRGWTFKTRESASCDLAKQDCPVGKACYATLETNVCAWAGIQAEGAACEFQNDCAAGFTCIDKTCKAFCALDAGDAMACAHVCTDGAASKLPIPGTGVCRR